MDKPVARSGPVPRPGPPRVPSPTQFGRSSDVDRKPQTAVSVKCDSYYVDTPYTVSVLVREATPEAVMEALEGAVLTAKAQMRAINGNRDDVLT